MSTWTPEVADYTPTLGDRCGAPGAASEVVEGIGRWAVFLWREGAPLGGWGDFAWAADDPREVARALGDLLHGGRVREASITLTLGDAMRAAVLARAGARVVEMPGAALPSGVRWEVVDLAEGRVVARGDRSADLAEVERTLRRTTLRNVTR